VGVDADDPKIRRLHLAAGVGRELYFAPVERHRLLRLVWTPLWARITARPNDRNRSERSDEMSDSVYRVTEVIGTSADSWEAAARNAVETAARTIRDLRIAEATRFDVTIQDGRVAEYRVRLGISFKYESGD